MLNVARLLTEMLAFLTRFFVCARCAKCGKIINNIGIVSGFLSMMEFLNRTCPGWQ
jgi:hypothetical protein